ncbi:hypothetical protein ACP70R_034303 [Stipagrostis hirtigluma subsp. patula]
MDSSGFRIHERLKKNISRLRITRSAIPHPVSLCTPLWSILLDLTATDGLCMRAHDARVV